MSTPIGPSPRSSFEMPRVSPEPPPPKHWTLGRVGKIAGFSLLGATGVASLAAGAISLVVAPIAAIPWFIAGTLVLGYSSYKVIQTAKKTERVASQILHGNPLPTQVLLGGYPFEVDEAIPSTAARYEHTSSSLADELIGKWVAENKQEETFFEEIDLGPTSSSSVPSSMPEDLVKEAVLSQVRTDEELNAIVDFNQTTIEDEMRNQLEKLGCRDVNLNKDEINSEGVHLHYKGTALVGDKLVKVTATFDLERVDNKYQAKVNAWRGALVSSAGVDRDTESPGAMDSPRSVNSSEALNEELPLDDTEEVLMEGSIPRETESPRSVNSSEALNQAFPLNNLDLKTFVDYVRINIDQIGGELTSLGSYALSSEGSLFFPFSYRLNGNEISAQAVVTSGTWNGESVVVVEMRRPMEELRSELTSDEAYTTRNPENPDDPPSNPELDRKVKEGQVESAIYLCSGRVNEVREYWKAKGDKSKLKVLLNGREYILNEQFAAEGKDLYRDLARYEGFTLENVGLFVRNASGVLTEMNAELKDHSRLEKFIAVLHVRGISDRQIEDITGFLTQAFLSDVLRKLISIWPGAYSETRNQAINVYYTADKKPVVRLGYDYRMIDPEAISPEIMDIAEAKIIAEGRAILEFLPESTSQPDARLIIFPKPL